MRYLTKNSSVFLMVLCTLSAGGLSSKQKEAPPPMPQEQQNDYYGFIGGSYTYWIDTRESGGVFVSNFYATPSTAPAQGTVDYFPRSTVSGFKVAAGFGSKERESMFMVDYTWYRNKNSAVGSFSFPGGIGYNKPTLLNTTGGTAQKTTTFQRVDGALVNGPGKMFKYLEFKPIIAIIGAWDHETTTVTFNNATSGTSSLTTNQNWWAVGPELGVSMDYDLYKGDNYNFAITSMLGLGECWGQTNTTYLDYNNFSKATTQSSKDISKNVSSVVDVRLGVAFEHNNMAETNLGVYLGVSWDLQAWVNNFSSSNNSYWTLQGLTVNAGLDF